MALEDIIKFRLKRVNPFQGLVIDADTWQDAHNYHRDQQRLHMLAFHEIGIVEGLGVTANNPPDLSVNIGQGMATDPEGNIVIVHQTQRYRIQTRDKGTIYLIIQFREVPSEPYQPPEGGQPTRIVEAYRIQEREKLPAEPYLELARIDFDPAQEAIRDAKTASNPGKNEINLSFRQEAEVTAPPAAVQVTPQEPAATAPKVTSRPKETIIMGHAVMGEASKNLHSEGLSNLIREITQRADFVAKLEKNITLDKNISRCTMLYLTGNSRFESTAEQQAHLNAFLQSGGVVLGEGCSGGETESRGAKEFGLAFNQLASQLKCKLEIVQRGHSLLSAIHVFADVPQGAEGGMLLEGGHMIYSGSDYGCAWQGGHERHPLAREIIRNSIEMGANLVAYAKTTKEVGR
ncbi:MAG: DUF4159 domain-containing protein [Dehalococcoidia bacterium]|jgi:hypothetical protein